ncbi:MAG TPA: alkaline phosphatase family protein, partial [Chloroflexota bacterium]
QLFPRHTVYQRLAEHSVPSFVLQSRDYTPSALSSVVCDGATITPFDDLQGGLNSLCALNESLKTRYYATLYWGAIDAASHHDGPESPQFADAVDSCFQLLESALHRRLTEHGRKTLLLLTADHGQTAVDPATTIYLNREVPGIDGWIARNRRGDLLVPAGSARDMFLHIYPDRLDEAEMRLREHLQGRAAVHRVDDLIAQGFFGRGEPGRAFLERVANLVVLPLGQESVWWLEPGKFSMTFRGHHGGLTPAEMETELLALAYG